MIFATVRTASESKDYFQHRSDYINRSRPPMLISTWFARFRGDVFLFALEPSFGKGYVIWPAVLFSGIAWFAGFTMTAFVIGLIGAVGWMFMSDWFVSWLVCAAAYKKGAKAKMLNTRLGLKEILR